MKKVFYLLVIILLNTITSASIYAQTSFSGGAGTEQNPYLIETENDLILMRDYCGGEHVEHFRLTKDIHLSKWETPIGDEGSPFKGYFHGGGNKITGLQMTNRNTTYVGLFGYSEGTIDSLYIEGTTIKGEQYVGGLVGYNSGSIIFCHTKIAVDGMSLSSASYVGGLVGYNSGSIESSSVEGDVTNLGTTAAYSGGLVGYNEQNNIINSYAREHGVESTVPGTGTAYAGGLVGYLSSGSVVDCYTTLTLSTNIGNNGHQYTGAVAGYNHSGAISNCYYNTDKTSLLVKATGNGNNGTAEGKTTNGMKTRDVYSGWNFNTVWGIKDGGVAYPYLRDEPLRLNSITANRGTLAPAFHPDTLIYTVDITNNYSDITITATSAIVGATITGNITHSGLKNGKNAIPITVEHDGGKLIYTVNVHKEYTLTLDAQGGIVNPSTVTITSGVNPLPVPELQGYDFVEWNTKSSGDSIAYNNYTVQDAIDITILYAKWEPKQYTVRFNANTSDISIDPDPIKVTFGSPVGNLPAPTTRTGYDFTGWNNAPDSTAGKNYDKNTLYDILSDTTFYAKWQAKIFTLTFNANGGTVSPTSKPVKYDTAVGSLPTPTRPGWTFLEWNTKQDGTGTEYESTTVYRETSNTTIYAIWEGKTYTVQFDPQGGTPQPENRTISYGASVGTLPTLNPRPNYEFKGWNTTPDGKNGGVFYSNNQKYEIDADTTFYAIWEGAKYSISFDIDYTGGTNPASKPVNYGDVVGKLDMPTSRTGYTFKGWYTQKDGNGTKYDSATVFTETKSITLYAKWDANKYKLKFDTRGGSPANLSPKDVTYGSAIGALPSDPSRPRFTFDEWNIHPDGTGDTYTGATVYLFEKDTTIYAQWTGESYSLIFNPDGGTVNPTTQSVSYGAPVGTLPKPVRSGYDFAGWFTATSGGGTRYTESIIFEETVNTNLYANWTPQKYKLYLNSNGGIERADSLVVTYGLVIGNALTTKSTPFTRVNYTLDGWNTQPNGSGDTYDENATYNVAGNTTLYAQWKGKDITVRFNASPVTPNPPDKTVTYGAKIGELPTDIRPGYTVVWKDGSKSYDLNTTVQPAGGIFLMLTAEWSPKPYTLTFDPQIGTVNPTSISVIYNAVVGELPVPSCAGYEFKGWFTGKGGSGTQYTSATTYNIPDNSTVYAKWECTITFDVIAGACSSVLSPQTVVYDSPVGTLPDPLSDIYGYTFDGWNTKKDGTGVTYTEETKATGNVILYARWQGLLEFKLDGADPDELLPQLTTKPVYYGNPIGATPRNIWPGHFPTWYDNNGYSGNIYDDQTLPPDGLILYADWALRKYMITFKLNYPDGGGDEVFHKITDISFGKPVNENVGGSTSKGSFPANATIPAPLYYEFKEEWNTQSDGKGETVTVGDGDGIYKFNDDIILYAQWEGVNRTLKFDGNYDGAISLSDITVKYGAPVGTLYSISRTGYQFVNWNDSKTGDGNNYTPETVYRSPSGEIKLYAKWKPNVYLLFLDAQDGTALDSISVIYDNYVGTIPEPAEREGYIFKEWNTAPDGKGTKYTANTVYNVVGNSTIYAKWDTIVYKLTFDANGGTVAETEKIRDVKYNSSLSGLPDPTFNGYNFKEWNTAKDGSGDVYANGKRYTKAENTILYAQWKANTYTIIFKNNGGGNAPLPIDVTFRQSITLPTMARNNYVFESWNTAADGSGTTYDGEITYTEPDDITLFAQWTGDLHTITLNPNGGTVHPQSIDVNYGSQIGELPDPVLAGHQFKGWTYGNQPYNSSTTYMVAGDITLTAEWSPSKYTVTYDINDGVTPPLQISNLLYNDEITLPTRTRTGYTHTGWKDRKGISYDLGQEFTVTQDTTFYAQWEIKKYTVTFDAQGGTPVATQKVEHNSTITAVSTRAGHSFEGWFTAINGGGTKYDVTQPVTGDVALYAYWTINDYTITYHENYVGAPTPVSSTKPYETDIPLPVPTRTGYTFNGWNTAHDGSGTQYTAGFVYTLTANTTLYAQWEIKKYTVTFEEQGGTTVKDQDEIAHNSKIKLPEITRTGYKFKGWFTTSDGNVKYNATVISDTTVYAQWEIIIYTISFNDPASSTIISKPITYGASIGILPSVSKDIPVRTGYILSGWNTEKDGSGGEYKDNAPYNTTSDIILYAQWTPETYKISFDSKGGASVDDHSVRYNVAIGKLPVPVREGYVFDGWFTGANGSGVEYTSTTVYKIVGSTTLFAKWTAGAYTLQFDARGGTIESSSKPVVYGTAVGELPVISLVGYEFGGWFTEIDGGGTKYVSTIVYDVAGNTTLYAKWTLKKCTITFDSQGGAPVAGIPANYNDNIALSVPSHPGYTFKGWNTAKDGTGISYIGTIPYTIDGDATLYAQWTVNVYELDFDEQGGNHVNNQSATYDAATGTLPKPTRTGYTFKGWFTGINGGGVEYTSTTVYKIAGNTTLYAFWEATKYALLFDVNHAGGLNPLSQTVAYGKSIVSLPTVARPGYIFKEWNTAQDGSGTAYTVETVYTETDNMTLYAQWVAGVYIISFEANYLGDIVKPENPTPKNIVYSAVVGELPVLTHAGYIFTGWNTAENGSGVTYTEATIYAEPRNITLYAQWKGISYTASFTGDNVEIDPQPVTHGTKIVRPSDPTLQGYVFGGWYKDNDLWDFNTPVTGNVVLKAKWISSDSKLKSLTITQGKMSPEFSPSLTDYMVLLSYNVATINVTGMSRHPNASVIGNVENASLTVGDNIISVEVTAEDGVNKTTYRILVTRADHTLVPDANLLSLSANRKPVPVEGNTLEYVAACGETSFALELKASPHASIFVNDSLYSESKGLEIEMTGDVTRTYIHIVSETGVVKDYVLTANKAIYSDHLYYKPWPDVLSIIANPKNNDEYEILGYRWYRHDGKYVGNKGFIDIESTKDYAEIRTVQTEGWRRVCGTTVTKSIAKITAYPNPVPSGESVKMELPDQYVGGTLNIYDITGALVKSGLPLPVSTNSIDVSSLNSGIYLFNITDKDGGNHQSVKIIVE